MHCLLYTETNATIFQGIADLEAMTKCDIPEKSCPKVNRLIYSILVDNLLPFVDIRSFFIPCEVEVGLSSIELVSL